MPDGKLRDYDAYKYQKRYKDSKRGRYTTHKCNAKQRGIPFLLTFEEWADIWQKSGHWDERGNKLDDYVMMRTGDTGAYKVGNVFIGKFRRNFNEGKKLPRKKHTAKTDTVLFHE
jgi:hypothetical protein